MSTRSCRCDEKPTGIVGLYIFVAPAHDQIDWIEPRARTARNDAKLKVDFRLIDFDEWVDDARDWM